MLILSMILILATVLIGICNAQEPTNYLKVKGQILKEHVADIYVYQQNDVTKKWERKIVKTNKTKYKLRLATNKNYQIVYISESGPKKTIYIKKGNPGMFIEYVDIDFKDSLEQYAYMSQNKKYEYVFQTKLVYFAKNLE